MPLTKTHPSPKEQGGARSAGSGTLDGVDLQIRRYNPCLFRPRKTCQDYFLYPKDKKLGEGTYGIVYKGWDKGVAKQPAIPNYAIKEMKRPVDPEHAKLSVSACREIMLLRELSHENVVWASEIFPDQNLQIFIVFEYAAYDLQNLILHHRYLKDKGPRWEIPESTVKSIMWQMLNGLNYMHTNWVLHRDLKPQNILIIGQGPHRGRVKIADLGMARIFKNPLKPLVQIDQLVVTIWYRAPEILLLARHYTKAVDIWSLGCIFGELMTTRPLFHVQHGQPEQPVHQRNQVKKIFDIIGLPKQHDALMKLPECGSVVREMTASKIGTKAGMGDRRSLYKIIQKDSNRKDSYNIIELLQQLLAMNPVLRISANDALQRVYFTQPEATFSRHNCFHDVVIDLDGGGGGGAGDKARPHPVLDNANAARAAPAPRGGILPPPPKKRKM